MLDGISGAVSERGVNIKGFLPLLWSLHNRKRSQPFVFQSYCQREKTRLLTDEAILRSDNCRISNNYIFRFCLKSTHEKEFISFCNPIEFLNIPCEFQKLEMTVNLLFCAVPGFHGGIENIILEDHSRHNLEVKKSQMENTFLFLRSIQKFQTSICCVRGWRKTIIIYLDMLSSKMDWIDG